MDKRLLFAAILLVVFIPGCLGEVNEPVVKETPAPSPSPTPAATPTPSIEELKLEIGDTAKTSVLKVTVISVDRTKSYQYYSDVLGKTMVETAPPGKDFVIADVLIKNVASDRVYVALFDFSLVDSDGYRYDPELYLGDDGIEFLQELYPEELIRGKVLFEVPEHATGLKIRYDFGDLFTGVKLASWTIPDTSSTQTAVYSTPTPTPSQTYSEVPAPLIQVYLPKTVFTVGEGFRAEYDVFNVVHNGKYDIHIYEELFDSAGRQLWPDYDIGRESGSVSGSKLHYACTTTLTKPGIYTLRVTIHDYMTNKLGYAEVTFEVVG